MSFGETSLFRFDEDRIRFVSNMICVEMGNLRKAVENGARSTAKESFLIIFSVLA